MLSRLIKLVLLIVVILIGYNYFFGDEEEQQQSQEIIDKSKEMGSALFEFVKSESERIQEGKYNDVIDNISAAIESLKNKENVAEAQAIEQDLSETQKKVNELDDKSGTEKREEQDSIEQRLERILDRVEELKNGN